MSHDLPAPARRLYEILLGQADKDGRCELREDWLLREMGCGSARLRRYRGDLTTEGLATIRKFGDWLKIQLLPASPAREKCDTAPSERAKSVTLSLFDDADARENCDDMRAKTVTPDLDARENCDAGSAPERAKTVTLDPEAREKCDAKTVQRAKSVTLSSRARREGGRLINISTSKSLTSLPTPQPPASQFARAAASVDVAERSVAPVWEVAPASPDYTRNRALLEDPELGIEDGPSIDWIAQRIGFEDLLRQVFAFVSIRKRQDVGPGLLVYRCKKHIANPDLFRAGPVEWGDQFSDLYRRHCVMVAPEPEPEPEPEPQPEPPAPPRALPTVYMPERDDDVWQIAKSQLRLQLPNTTWATWVKDTRGEFDADGRLTVYAPSAYAREWLHLRLRRLIAQTLISIKGAPVEVDFVCREGVV